MLARSSLLDTHISFGETVHHIICTVQSIFRCHQYFIIEIFGITRGLCIEPVYGRTSAVEVAVLVSLVHLLFRHKMIGTQSNLPANPVTGDVTERLAALRYSLHIHPDISRLLYRNRSNAVYLGGRAADCNIIYLILHFETYNTVSGFIASHSRQIQVARFAHIEVSAADTRFIRPGSFKLSGIIVDISRTFRISHIRVSGKRNRNRHIRFGK